MHLGVMLTRSNVVPAGLAHSMSAVSEVNVCGAKPFRNPIGMSSKTCKVQVSFYFSYFQSPTSVGRYLFGLFYLATACINFHLKHYSIPLDHENVELRWTRNRRASLAVVWYCTMESCVWMDKGIHVDGSELVLVLMAASKPGKPRSV